jgi:hypothetical protein
MQQIFDLVGQIARHAHGRSRCLGEEISPARPLYEITPRRYPEATAGERTGDIWHNRSIGTNHKSHQLLLRSHFASNDATPLRPMLGIFPRLRQLAS